MRHGSGTDSRAAQMRTEFDRSFAIRPAPPMGDPHSVLTVVIDELPCLIRLSEVSRLVSRPVLTAVPTPMSALLGLTFSQGDVVAVYDLGRLLGKTPMPPHWLVVTAADPTIGLAFAQFDGHREIAGEIPDSTYLDLDALIDSVRSADRTTTLETMR